MKSTSGTTRPPARPSLAAAKKLHAFCKVRLAKFTAPKSPEYRELPETATGKFQKFKLREKAWQGREKRVNCA
ncbi:MAG: hypothetical protein NTU74_12610 [Deltaproteobacteria bacterium]|nr:hypothetical protein [Deltaproteobacteria bacterium]